ncbi:DegT/DnrJ/EryC1/StrS family aminotransferase [Prauserella cavernicola]|uniref:DegT/DnrJ/EryC1/StrS family aminotransferase n=1 Tax=Prauserella cavernicola TaxID=2800127 RepID=A0A934V599_9PSEU|nr:DegT/DnrJ/EryC1/StrS family aminotransferase [Prauserella cavernicola]MBK1784378.1 DegT/DnrJ/EryC1/StrS family aminotransferase [Prauserella cavernicola]
MIPLSVIDLRDAEAHVAEVLRSGRVSRGPVLETFEREFAAVAGTRYAIAVQGGTAALVTALRALGLRAGDEVLTSPLLPVATLDAIVEAGATARFADIARDDFALDPDAAAGAITTATRVLLPAHLFGQTGDLAKHAAIAAESGLRLVEDAQQAAGATCAGAPAGSFGLGCFSTPEAGVVTTDDAELAGRLRDEARHVVLPELHAALALARLERLSATTAARRYHAQRLTEGLRGTPGLDVPRALPDREHGWQQYSVLIGPHAMLSRDELADALTERGVGNGVCHPRLVFDHDRYARHPLVPPVSPRDFPSASRVSEEMLTLPVHPALTETDLDTIIDVVREELGA